MASSSATWPRCPADTRGTSGPRRWRTTRTTPSGHFSGCPSTACRARPSRTTSHARTPWARSFNAPQGKRLSEYLRPRLFEPLGITDTIWTRHRGGLELGQGGLHVRTEAIAALGELYRRRGRWGTRQVLPAGWADLAAAPHMPTSGDAGPDWRSGYGFQFWQSRHGYRADGAFGQFCLVLPEQAAVVALTAATMNMQAVLDAVWEHLLPAMDRAPSEPGAADRLARRLDGLEVPTVAGDTQHRDGARSSGSRFGGRPPAGDSPSTPARPGWTFMPATASGSSIAARWRETPR